MEQNVRQMIAPGLETTELIVQQVGEPGQGMPVGALVGGEGPVDALRGQAVFQVPVPIDVVGVVEVDEVEGDRLAEDDGDRQQEQAADDCRHAEIPGREFRAGRDGGEVAARRCLPATAVSVRRWRRFRFPAHARVRRS